MQLADVVKIDPANTRTNRLSGKGRCGTVVSCVAKGEWRTEVLLSPT